MKTWFSTNIRNKPARTVFLSLGVLATLHAVFYAFTGLSFAAPSSGDEARGALLVVLHAVAITAGGFSLMAWNDRL